MRRFVERAVRLVLVNCSLNLSLLLPIAKRKLKHGCCTWSYISPFHLVCQAFHNSYAFHYQIWLKACKVFMSGVICSEHDKI